MVHAPSPLGAGTFRWIKSNAALSLASSSIHPNLTNPRIRYRVNGPAAIMSISMRAPGELKLLMQIVVLAGRHSPK